MKRLLANALFVYAVIVIAGLAMPAAAPANPSDSRIPVVLELFTSEGCSSCPPADRLLESLDRQPVANADLIVLSEHVDYWNDLGWSDPYSSAAFSQRQRNYFAHLGTDVYTPQLVIDGQSQVLGSDQQQVMQAIRRATQNTKLPVSISATSRTLHIEANRGEAKADLYIAIAADHASSKVLRGENGGQVLTHVAIVESISKIGKWDAASRDIALPPISKKRAGQAGVTRVIVLLVDPQTDRILGAAQTRI